jgi:DNA polymerase
MPDPRRALRQKLADWQRAGVTHVPPGEPLVPGPAAQAQLPESRSELSQAEREQQLAAMADLVSRCVRCQELALTRRQTVFGVGDPHARVMFIGEAPGAEEDAQGEPFVGRAGQLLDRIIAACGWKRKDIYICNILKCRPPGNRNPAPQEAANCREYLDGQIRLVDPEYIVCWGAVAAQNLLDETAAIGRLRQKWFAYGRAKVLCTYHPSYLLRNPDAKKPVWEDMKFLLADMGLTPPDT